jgi:hypothetical protein
MHDLTLSSAISQSRAMWPIQGRGRTPVRPTDRINDSAPTTDELSAAVNSS